MFGPGTYTLTVSNPHSFFQVDFVSGYAIDHLGPANSNIFYSNQNRLVSADNGGTRAVLASPASLTGTVYRDTNNNGLIDAGEQPIAGVKVTATASSTTQSVVTDTDGVYTFDNLPAGSYTITETQPGDYTDGKDTLGNKGGSAAVNDKFSGIALSTGASGTGYNFGEQQALGSAFAGTQTQTIAWWNGTNGQALIKALNGGPTAKNLGNWLASNFNNLFGVNSGANNLSGKTNAQVAAFYQSLYSNVARKPESETLALALAVYVTTSNLAGTTAASPTYGFGVTSTGLGSATTSVGTSGAAFGINDGTVMTIGELLSRINVRSRNGFVWDVGVSGSFNLGENILRSQVNTLFDTINTT